MGAGAIPSSLRDATRRPFKSKTSSRAGLALAKRNAKDSVGRIWLRPQELKDSNQRDVHQPRPTPRPKSASDSVVAARTDSLSSKIPSAEPSATISPTTSQAERHHPPSSPPSREYPGPPGSIHVIRAPSSETSAVTSEGSVGTARPSAMPSAIANCVGIVVQTRPSVPKMIHLVIGWIVDSCVVAGPTRSRANRSPLRPHRWLCLRSSDQLRARWSRRR
jgi:hypothetical protein